MSNGTAPTCTRPGTNVPAPRPAGLRDACTLLRDAAAGLRCGAIGWAREAYIDRAGDRCAAGAITWAADPTLTDGDPRFAGPAARLALVLLGEYLVDELYVQPCRDGDGEPDWAETVGMWNDEQQSVDDVISALASAAVLSPAVAR